MWAIHKMRLGTPVCKQTETAGTTAESESQTETDPQVGHLLLGSGNGCGLSENLTLITRWELDLFGLQVVGLQHASASTKRHSISFGNWKIVRNISANNCLE